MCVKVTGGVHEIQGRSLIIRPNRSLPVGGMVLLFAAALAWGIAVGGAFLVRGAGMVLPFIALVVLGLGALLRRLYVHRDDCELVTVDEDRVHITKRSGNAVTRHEFQRYWLRVRWGRTRHGESRGRLLVGSHGRFVALGDEIDDRERELLARDLQRLLRVP
ncbi:MAG TPA: DUF2244 domain-containing protein [Burkholderiales bacterium]